MHKLNASVLVAGAVAGAVLAVGPAQAAWQAELSQSWGSATVSAERRATLFDGWEVPIQVTARDQVADGKCVYVEYKVITRGGTSADSTLATACNQQTVTKSTTRVVGSRLGIATPTAVEFKMCKAVWGPDPCTKTRVPL